MSMSRAIVPFALALAGLLTATPSRAQEYAIGADLSFLKQAEDGGMQFKDTGQVEPAMQIFQDHGYNWVRLRLFHDPAAAAAKMPNGQTYKLPNDLPYTIASAQEAKQHGMKFLLDLHFSDSWVDPGKQPTPAAWATLTHEQLVDSVFAYTRAVMVAFREAGVWPDMVQPGNEITNGMLWPDGRLGSQNPDGWTHFGELLKAAIAGIDAAATPEALPPPIMIHIDRGGDEARTKWFFDHLIEQGVPFDAIGQSYYPWWHGSLLALRANLDFMAHTYHRPIYLAEVAYNWRPTTDMQGRPKPFPESPEGQRAFLDEVNRIVLDTPNHLGKGVFWWEPAVGGAGARGIYSRGMFDEDGNALPVITVYDKYALH